MTTEADLEPGMFVFLTKPNCPACVIFKQDEMVQRALECGDAVEAKPDDDLYETVMDRTDVEVLPGVVEYTEDGFVAVD